MSKISHYFKRRKALKLFADRFLFEPLRPLAPQGQVVNPPQQPQTVYKPEVQVQPQVAPQPVNQVPVQPVQPIQPAPTGPGTPIAPPQPTQIPVQQAPVQAPLPPPPTDQMVRTIQPMPQTARDVINRRLT